MQFLLSTDLFIESIRMYFISFIELNTYVIIIGHRPFEVQLCPQLNDLNK